MTQQLYPGFYEEPLLCFADDVVVVVAVDSLWGGKAPRGKKKKKSLSGSAEEILHPRRAGFSQ